MPTFGIIAEGVTDQVIIENLLVGYFQDPDLEVRALQPLRDNTDKQEVASFGGWYQVLEYCQSEVFIGAFQQNDYVIIHIDTDRCEDKHYDVSKLDENGKTAPPALLIERVKSKFLALFEECFGQEFYDQYHERILFAIAVHETECWLLPLFLKSHHKSSVNKCLDKLNHQLRKDKQRTINRKNKDYRLYDQFSRRYLKKKEIDRHASENPSLAIFLDELKRRDFVIHT